MKSITNTSTPNSLTLNVSGKNIAPSPNVSQQALATKNTGVTTAFLAPAVKTPGKK